MHSLKTRGRSTEEGIMSGKDAEKMDGFSKRF